jgi:hypothetical protein
MGRCTGLLLLFMCFTSLKAQELDKIRFWEDSLQQLGIDMYQNPNEPERLQSNFLFVRTLVQALKMPESFHYTFDSLHMISKLYAPDRSFRLISWHIPLNDGSYLYYGTIQMQTEDGQLQLFPLMDKTFEMEAPHTSITSNNQWYGAQYYEIIPFNDSYLLVGWKGHSSEITQKVIEVLTFDKENGTPQLGKTIFQSNAHVNHARIIFSFAKGLHMYVRYHEKERQIVFDHLVPQSNSHVGNYAFYGPDMSLNAWFLGKDKLEWKENIPLERN